MPGSPSRPRRPLSQVVPGADPASRQLCFEWGPAEVLVCETRFDRGGGSPAPAELRPGSGRPLSPDGIRPCRRRGCSARLLPRLRGAQGPGHLHPDPAQALQRVARHLRRPAALRGGAGRQVEESAVSGPWKHELVALPRF